MENRILAQKYRKVRNTTRAPTEHLQRGERFSVRADKQLTANSIKKRDDQYLPRCLFSDKSNLVSNPQVQLNKYINLRLNSAKKDKKPNIMLKAYKIKKNSRDFDRTMDSTAFYSHSFNLLNDGQQRQQIIETLNLEIKSIFKNIGMLKGYGFSQKKVTKWVATFLSRKSQNIQDIFIRSWENKKSLVDSIIFQRVVCVQSIVSGTEQLIEKLPLSDAVYLANEIKALKNYIQDLVIYKTQSNLNQIFENLPEDPILKFKHANHKLPTPPELLHFMRDLKIVEDRHGELASVSKLNRTMFGQLLEAEEKFANNFYTYQR